MPSGPIQLLIVGILYLLPLVALVLLVRRSLKRQDRAAENAEPITREELERRYSEGRLSRDEYLAVRGEISKEEDARALGREYDAE
ncbi:hypothetical protein BH24ACT16_BH24ACT16_11550 [soil metagenome]